MQQVMATEALQQNSAGVQTSIIGLIQIKLIKTDNQTLADGFIGFISNSSVVYGVKYMDYAGGGREGNDSAGKTPTAQLNARLPPRNLLTCALLLDQISSSRLWRPLKPTRGWFARRKFRPALVAAARAETADHFPRTSPRRKRRRRSVVAIPLARSLLFILHLH